MQAPSNLKHTLSFGRPPCFLMALASWPWGHTAWEWLTCDLMLPVLESIVHPLNKPLLRMPPSPHRGEGKVTWLCCIGCLLAHAVYQVLLSLFLLLRLLYTVHNFLCSSEKTSPVHPFGVVSLVPRFCIFCPLCSPLKSKEEKQ